MGPPEGKTAVTDDPADFASCPAPGGPSSAGYVRRRRGRGSGGSEPFYAISLVWRRRFVFRARFGRRTRARSTRVG